MFLEMKPLVESELISVEGERQSGEFGLDLLFGQGIDAEKEKRRV